MVTDILISIGSPAIGGVIAAVAGWKVTKWDRKKDQEAKKKQWYVSLSRLSREINISPTTALFMELGTDQSRKIQEYQQIADQLDQERYEAPPDADLQLIRALYNTSTNARRIGLDRNDHQIKLAHYKMWMYGEEIHYHIQKELSDDMPVTFDQERMDRVEDRIATRREMDSKEWRKKVIDDMHEKLAEDRAAKEEEWNTPLDSDNVTDKEDSD